MKILVLNGSPRINGNTAAMIKAFEKGISETEHTVEAVNICRENINGCLCL